MGEAIDQSQFTISPITIPPGFENSISLNFAVSPGIAGGTFVGPTTVQNVMVDVSGCGTLSGMGDTDITVVDEQFVIGVSPFTLDFGVWDTFHSKFQTFIEAVSGGGPSPCSGSPPGGPTGSISVEAKKIMLP